MYTNSDHLFGQHNTMPSIPQTVVSILSLIFVCHSQFYAVATYDHTLECFKVVHRQIFTKNDVLAVWPIQTITSYFLEDLYISNHSLFIHNGNDTTETPGVTGNIHETDKLQEFNKIVHSSQGRKLLVVSALPLSDMEMTLRMYNIGEIVVIYTEDASSKFLVYQGCKSSALLMSGKCSYNNFIQKYQAIHNHSSLKGCHFQIQTMIWPPYVLLPSNMTFSNGLEILIVNTLARHTQFSVEYTVGDQRNLESTHQIGIGSYYAKNELHTKYDTFAYNVQESFTWCVPFVSLPTRTNVFLAMQAHVWISLQIVHFAVSTAIWLLSVSAPNESTSFKTYASVLQNIVATMLNKTVNVQPRTFKVRFLFMLYVIFTLHVNVAYESALFSVLTKPKQEQKISSVHHINNAKFKLYYIPGTIEYLGADETSDRWESCHDGTACISKASNAEDFALFMPYLHINYILNYDNSVNVSVYCFDNHQVTVPIEMVFEKGFPFKDHFEKFTYSIMESGIYDKWKRDIFYERKTIVIDEMPVIKVSHLTFLFGYVLVLWTFAFISFLLEIYLDKRREHNMRLFHTN